MKVKTVLPGIYASNYWTSIPPRKQPDGSFVVAQPMSPQTRLPILDAAHDFGRYVLAAVQDGGPDKVLAGGHYLSLEEIAAVMAKCGLTSALSEHRADTKYLRLQSPARLSHTGSSVPKS